MTGGLIVLIVLAVFVLFVAARTIRIVPQARAGIVERLGRYARTLDAGLTIIVPFVDRLKPLIDLREQVVSFPPQPVITEDNLVVQIDTVIYFQVTDAKDVTAEGQKQAAILRSQGEAQAIQTVFSAIHAGRPDSRLLSYQYLQMLPQIAQGDSNKIWVIPSEFTQALGQVGSAFGLGPGGKGG